MKSFVVVVLILLASFEIKAQAPVLVVNRIDKFTKELIKQTSMYSFKDAGGVTKLYFSVRSVDDDYYIQFNVNAAVTIKKGTEITLLLDDGKSLKLNSDNDIISLSEADINKRMFVCSLDQSEVNTLLKQQVTSIKIPTSNKGTLTVGLLPNDRGMIRSGMALLGPKAKPKGK
jgi:hypothetical protein